jgi:hypothetical protein
LHAASDADIASEMSRERERMVSSDAGRGAGGKISSRGARDRPRRGVSLRVILSIAVWSAPAWADRAIAVDVDGPAPFASDQLAQALRVRLGDGAPVRVRVVATDGGVIVSARGGSQVVALGGREGADAARLVALVAVDLVEDDLAVAPEPLQPIAPPSSIAARVVPLAPRVPDPVTIGISGAAAQWSGLLAGASIDVAVPRGRWIVTAEVGGGELIAGGLDLRAATIRAGGGVRTGWIDLRAGLTLAPVEVTSGFGDATVLAGAGASARLRVPVADGLRVVIAAGADAYATRTEYTMNGMPFTATPWLAPWLAAGVEVTP